MVDNSVFKIPFLEPAEMYDFSVSEDQFVYDELSAIQEEIAQCRENKLKR
jgi:hypothetical protein